MSLKRVCDNCEKTIGALAPYVITDWTDSGASNDFDLCSTKCISDWAIARGQK